MMEAAMRTIRRSTMLMLPAAVAALAALLALPAAAPAQNPPCYEVTEVIYGPDCGSPYGLASVHPWAISDEAHIAGYIRCPLGYGHSFIWQSPGPIVQIPMPSGTYRSRALDVNCSGCVAGWLESDGHYGYFYDGSAVTIIEPLPGGSHDDANALNNAGQVTGFSTTAAPGEGNAFLWQDGVLTDLGGVIGGYISHGNDIGDGDPWRIVGTRWMQQQSDPTAFLLEGDEFTDLGPIPGGFSSEARAVNNNREVAGFGAVPHSGPIGEEKHAFYWSEGQMIDLGVLPGYERSVAYDINDASSIVGYCDHSLQLPPTGFLWQDGEMTDVNDLLPSGSGLVLSSARGINNDGQIVAAGRDAGGDFVAVLLSPMVADLTGDCIVNVDDLLILLGAWGPCAPPPTDCPADLNGSGEVDTLDLLILLGNWN